MLQLSTIRPYLSFPIDLMHLVMNIGKGIISLWLSQTDYCFCSSKEDVISIDEILRSMGKGISSQLGICPREIAKHRDWKAEEVKSFVLRYSLVVLDQYLPQSLLNGWFLFVKLMDLCHNPFLTTADVTQISKLSLKFYKHFEDRYYAYDHERVKFCKYMIHLLLNLSESILENGPLCNYSQYTTERYIGWLYRRLHAQNLPAASFFQISLYLESYKIYFNESIHQSEEHKSIARFASTGSFQ